MNASQARAFTTASAVMILSSITATALTLGTQESTVKLKLTNARQIRVCMEIAVMK